VKSSKKNKSIHLTPNELEDIITRAVEKALSKAIPRLIEHKKTVPITVSTAELIDGAVVDPRAESVSSMTPTAPLAHKKRKRIEPISMPSIAKKKARKNGYAVAFGLPSVITEVIHLQIMKLHGEGLTTREIEKQVNVSQASILRTINVST
jgi:hypothetical protein